MAKKRGSKPGIKRGPYTRAQIKKAKRLQEEQDVKLLTRIFSQQLAQQLAQQLDQQLDQQLNQQSDQRLSQERLSICPTQSQSQAHLSRTTVEAVYDDENDNFANPNDIDTDNYQMEDETAVFLFEEQPLPDKLLSAMNWFNFFRKTRMSKSAKQELFRIINTHNQQSPDSQIQLLFREDH